MADEQKPETGKAPDGAGAIERKRLRDGRVRFFVRLRMTNGTRPRVRLGEDLSEAMARAKADAIAERVREKGLRPPPKRKGRPPEIGATVRGFGEAWTSGALLRRHGPVNKLKVKASADVDAWRLGRMYELRPRGPKGLTFGELPVAEVTEADIERVLAEAVDPDAAAATRVQFYAILRRLFDLAIMPGRLRKDSPVSKYLRPSKGGGKLFSYLYPSELLAILKASSIPVGRRVFYALAVYTGQRKSSLFGLRWRDVDLVNGVVTSMVQKNREPQPFGISPDLVRLLRRWHEESGKPGPAEAVIREVGVEKSREAKALRADLQAAGVTRAVLFGGDPRIEALRFHDMRATFVTWAKRAGRSEGWITDRTGHLDAPQVARYTRAARALEDLQIEPFPPLDGAIPELALVGQSGWFPGSPSGDLGDAKKPEADGSAPKKPRKRALRTPERRFRFQWGKTRGGSSPLLRTEPE